MNVMRVDMKVIINMGFQTNEIYFQFQKNMRSKLTYIKICYKYQVQQNFIFEYRYINIINNKTIQQLMNPYGKYKNLRIFKVLEIETQYKKHKQRLFKINSTTTHKDTTQQQRIQKINNFRKQKIISEVNKVKQKELKLAKQNNLIHDQLKRVYLRKNSLDSLRNSLRSVKSERSHFSNTGNTIERQYQQRIIQQNLRIRDKLVATKSKLNKKILLQGYESQHKIRDRISYYSGKKKQEVEKTLIKNFKIYPKVLFPSLKSTTKLINSQQKKDSIALKKLNKTMTLN